MEQENNVIKKEFDDKFNDIEKMDESKKKLINTICYAVAIIMFVCVLVGTIVSVNNYFNAKKKQDDKSNVPVVTLKNID